MRDVDRIFPVVVVADRYHGTYSGGLWFAVAEGDTPFDALDLDPTRAALCLDGGPNGPDDEAQAFWANPPSWIAVGSTPNDAVEALLARP